MPQTLLCACTEDSVHLALLEGRTVSSAENLIKYFTSDFRPLIIFTINQSSFQTFSVMPPAFRILTQQSRKAFCTN